jgi:hypothetical protein
MDQLVDLHYCAAKSQESNKLISKKLIGVNLQRASDHDSDGEISFGVVDNAKFHGSLAVVTNVGLSGLWEVPIVRF